jgi:hypothetical protein
MTRFVTRLAAWAFVATCTGTAFAADFSEADALMAKRGDGEAAVATARSAYEQMLPSLSGADLVYAVSRMAQLDTYLAEGVLPHELTDKRRAILLRCHDQLLPRISPDVVGETPEYYYWRGTCLALWADLATTMQRLTKVALLKQLLKGGMALDTRYQGGGIYRVFAGVAIHPGARPVGLYDPQGALEKLNQGIAAPAYRGDVLAGKDYYVNHHYKVEALRALNRKAEALEFARATVAEIEARRDSDTLPEGLEPETLHELKVIHNLVTELESEM